MLKSMIKVLTVALALTVTCLAANTALARGRFITYRPAYRATIPLPLPRPAYRGTLPVPIPRPAYRGALPDPMPRPAYRGTLPVPIPRPAGVRRRSVWR